MMPCVKHILSRGLILLALLALLLCHMGNKGLAQEAYPFQEASVELSNLPTLDDTTPENPLPPIDIEKVLYPNGRPGPVSDVVNDLEQMRKDSLKYHMYTNRVERVNPFSDPPPSFYTSAMQKYAGNKACWFCPIFQIVFIAIGQVSEAITVELSWKFVQLMGVMLLFIILFKVGKLLLQLQPQQAVNFLDDFFKPVGAVMIASSLLLVGMPDQVDETAKGGTNVYSYVLIPMMEASLALSDTIVESTQGSQYTSTTTQRSAGGSTTTREECSEGAVAAGVFSEEMDARFLCWLRSISSSLMRGIVTGLSFMFGAVDISWRDVWSFFWDEGKFYERLLMFTGGFIMLVAYFIIFIGLPFKIIDTLVRLGFILALVPLWVFFGTFKGLRGYAKTAMNMFVSCCVFFVFLGIIVSFVTHIMNASIADEKMSLVTKYLSQNKFDEAATTLNFTGMRFFFIICCAIISWSVMGTASSLATFLAGGSANLTAGDETAQTITDATSSTVRKTAALSFAAARQVKNAYQGAADRMRHWSMKASEKAARQRRWQPAKNGGVGASLFQASKSAENGIFSSSDGSVRFYRTENGVMSAAKTADGRRIVKTYAENGLVQREVFDEKGKKSILYDAKGTVIGTRLYGANGSYIQSNSDGTMVSQENGLEIKRDSNGQIISEQKWATKQDENGQTIIDKGHRITEIHNEDGSVTYVNEIGESSSQKNPETGAEESFFRVKERTTTTRAKDGSRGSVKVEKFKWDAKTKNYVSRRTEIDGDVVSERLYDQGGYKDIFFTNGRAEKLREGDSRTMFGQPRRHR